MKTLMEEYGDVILALVIVAGIFATTFFVLPLIQDTIIPFLESVGVV